ncbi:MAG TPA: glycogen/starch/alpha-glucan phosphorylase [Polyangiaceae bacterium]
MTDRSYLTASDLAMDRAAIERSFASHVEYTVAKDEYSVTPRDFYRAIALSVRDRIADRWNKTQQRTFRAADRRVYYLSLEYLIGRLLDDAMLNLGIAAEARGALADLGIDLSEIARYEDDAGLGNGGLGRLAACFMDSMATLGIPAVGYGIRYEYGIFRQCIVDGAQVEQPDNWLRYPNPWEVARPERIFMVRFAGRVEVETEGGRQVFRWVDTENVMAMAYDTPVPGYRNDVVNSLRLWSAKATREFDLSTFNRGDYVASIHDKTATENLSRVLYPNDQVAVGRELRLRQEYFFVSATLQDAIRRHLARWPSVRNLHEAAVFQLNDTHPAVAVAEMMRLLVDDSALSWDDAWAITTRAFAYTNHTVLPEALEQWSVALFGRVLPRHLQIVFEINRRFLDEVRARFPGDEARVRRMSLIEEGPEQRIRMAHLAIVGSAHVNGVSALHSRILRERLFRDFAELWPRKFGNQTNGVTPRRWLRKCNAPLSELVTSKIGEGWVVDLPQLAKLAPAAEEPATRAAFRAAKRANKERLAAYVERTMGVRLSPDALFDVQVKRIHEYKRQLLPILHAVHLHQLASRGEKRVPRVVLLAGKAAPGYDMAKRIIRLACDVSATLQRDASTRDRIELVFLPNYSVTLAELVIPAADLSEQVSTAGTEASGTGNMKLSLNGALTIGTLDGANVEIKEAVGDANIFVFGMTDEQVEARRRAGYDPRAALAADRSLGDVFEAIASGAYSGGDAGRHRPVLDALLTRDPFFVLADYPAYAAAQRDVEAAFLDPERWSAMALRNVAAMGRFSSDETIRGYARDIWRVPVER